jgi:hypothetical protein
MVNIAAGAPLPDALETAGLPKPPTLTESGGDNLPAEKNWT